MGKKFLITGGAGFIGSNFIKHLLKKYPDIKILNIDKLTYAGNLENLKEIENDERYKFYKGDIRDRELIRKLLTESDVIVNFAAETHVDRSILFPEEFILTDVLGTFTLLDELKKFKDKLFIHVSTDEVYGSIENGSFSEDDPLMPSSPYSASKAGGDRLAYSYFKTFNLPVIILRPCNNYGPHQFPEKLIPLFITNALEDRELPLYGDGQNIRDWLYVSDCCGAIDLIIKKGEIGEVYNIAASQEFPNVYIANKILELLNKPDSLIKFVKDRPGHDKRYSLKWEKIKKLGWQPEISINEGLKLTIKWYRENVSWWRKIKEESDEFKKFYKSYYEEVK
ncbi:MAG: dTDP-glucose 4,6-dehydratase [Acidobacteriota bacterium]